MRVFTYFIFGCNLMTLLILMGANYGMHKYSRGKIFGVIIPSGRENDEAVVGIVERYKKQNRIWMLFSFLTNFITLVNTPYVSFSIIALFLWLAVVIGGKLYISGMASESLKQLKYTRGWYDAVRDEDEQYWKWGVFYNNPNSKKILVNGPMGSSNVNIATKFGKGFMIVMSLILIGSFIILPIFVVMDDFIEPKVSITDEKISVHSVMEKGEMPIAAIDKIFITENLKIGSKMMGSATQLYARGIFYVSPYDRCEISIFKENPVVIVILPKGYTEMGKSESYNQENPDKIKPLIFNLKDKTETMQLYEKLVKSL